MDNMLHDKMRLAISGNVGEFYSFSFSTFTVHLWIGKFRFCCNNLIIACLYILMRLVILAWLLLARCVLQTLP